MTGAYLELLILCKEEKSKRFEAIKQLQISPILYIKRLNLAENQQVK